MAQNKAAWAVSTTILTYIIEAVFIYIPKNSNDITSTECQFSLPQKAHNQQLYRRVFSGLRTRLCINTYMGVRLTPQHPRSVSSLWGHSHTGQPFVLWPLGVDLSYFVLLKQRESVLFFCEREAGYVQNKIWLMGMVLIRGTQQAACLHSFSGPRHAGD